MARGTPVPDRALQHHGVTSRVNEVLLRTLTPTVIGILVRRGADFAGAEDAVQDALVEAGRGLPGAPPRGPQGGVGPLAGGPVPAAAPAGAPRRRRGDG